ncbi:hypothetical protein [Jeotgalibacillus aurantiacus]|uniref:hypothetical protein n=1 Tax=Jeotgalibacillus aurantiacus TaxID=2763266 RepID=UPI001D09A7EB|nr:hypothetical protein [Jeotgalibacillus aurantiacus]
MNRFLIVLWSVLGTLILAACNTSDTAQEESPETSASQAEEATQSNKEEHEEDEHHDHEHASSHARLAVSHENGVWIIDSEGYEATESFDTKTSAIRLAADDRHLFVSDRESGSVKLLDSGVWSEAHGDHAHDYVEAPSLSTFELIGDEPTHFVNHGGYSAIFYDGSGEVQVFDETAFTTENELTPVTTIQVAPHHGVAVPLPDGHVLASYTPEDNPQPLPEGVALFDAAGEEVERFAGCPGLHGEASGGSGDTETIAFGCEGQLLIYSVTEQEAIEIPLPDQNARVGTLKGLDNADYIVGNYSSEENPELNTHISILDLNERSVSTVDLGTEYVGSMAMDEEHAYVLGKDGEVYTVHLSTVEIEGSISSIEPIAPSEGHGHGAPSPSMSLVEGNLYITDPAEMNLTLVDLAHQEVEVVKTFETPPTAVIALKKGEAHDH